MRAHVTSDDGAQDVDGVASMGNHTDVWVYVVKLHESRRCVTPQDLHVLSLC